MGRRLTGHPDPDYPVGARSAGRVAIFGPNPMLSLTIENSADGNEIHVHPAGQGVWVARMAGEMGAVPVLCGFIGGETGATIRPLLERLPGELRLVEIGGPNGSYVHDRRSGARELIAMMRAASPTRHDVDELFSRTCAAALDCEVLVVCNPFPAEVLPTELYADLVSDVSGNGTPVLVDLSSPRLNSALKGGPVRTSQPRTGGPRWYSQSPTSSRARGSGPSCSPTGQGSLRTCPSRSWSLIPSAISVPGRSRS